MMTETDGYERMNATVVSPNRKMRHLQVAANAKTGKWEIGMRAPRDEYIYELPKKKLLHTRDTYGHF